MCGYSVVPAYLWKGPSFPCCSGLAAAALLSLSILASHRTACCSFSASVCVWSNSSLFISQVSFANLGPWHFSMYILASACLFLHTHKPCKSFDYNYSDSKDSVGQKGIVTVLSVQTQEHAASLHFLGLSNFTSVVLLVY